MKKLLYLSVCFICVYAGLHSVANADVNSLSNGVGLNPTEGLICTKILGNLINDVEENDQDKVKFVYNSFKEKFGEPSPKLNLGSREEARRNRINCGKAIFNGGATIKNHRQKAEMQWVAHMVALPDVLFPKPTSLSPEAYQALSQDERVDRIKEVDIEKDLTKIPRSLREADYKRAIEMGKPYTLGTFGLAGEDVDPMSDDEIIKKRIESLDAQIAETNKPERGALIMQKRNLQQVLKSTAPGVGGREKGVQFEKRMVRMRLAERRASEKAGLKEEEALEQATDREK